MKCSETVTVAMGQCSSSSLLSGELSHVTEQRQPAQPSPAQPSPAQQLTGQDRDTIASLHLNEDCPLDPLEPSLSSIIICSYVHPELHVTSSYKLV